MGFLTIFYKYIIQQYFIVQIFLPHPTAPTAPLRPHLRSSEFYITIFYKYIIQQYFTITAPNTAFSQYLKQIKY